MNRIYRYWTLWHTLPDDERRARRVRVVDRLLRRRRAIRGLGLAPDEPRASSLRRALRVEPGVLAARLRERDPRRGPLFDDLEARAAAVAERHPDHVKAVLGHAERIVEATFDLLGSGARRLARDGGGIEWHCDWKADLAWPQDVYYLDMPTVRGDGSDLKLPWELSRCQHLLILGQAYRLAPHSETTRDVESFRRRVARAVRDQMNDWIVSNPRGLGINWTCTMEVGIRATTWLAVLGLLRGAAELDDAFIDRVVASLWIHGRHIRGNLEVGRDGITTNHYLSDVVGLYAIACGLPELEESARWERFARQALEQEIERQVHADGVGFEGSIPYHRLVAELFVHAALLARGRGADFPPAWLARLSLMLEFTATAMRDDHSVAQWGDNDDGRLLPLQGYASRNPHDHRHLLALGGRVLARDDLEQAGIGADVEALWLVGPAPPAGRVAPVGRTSRGFPEAGYYIMRDADLHCGVACGRVGTSGIGNHSHNDVLSLCVWAGGFEWITDPGTGNYTGDPQLRNRMRSTAAHATLQLGVREQNALGTGLDGLFTMDERAHPEVTEWQADDRGASLTARHRGFSASDGRWTHERAIRFDPTGRAWRIRDELIRESGEGPVPEQIRVRFPLRPDVSCAVAESVPEPVKDLLDGEQVGAAGSRSRFAVQLRSNGAGTFWIALDLPTGSAVSVEPSYYSERYGVTCESSVVTATLPAAARTVALSALWSPAVPR